MIRRLDAVRQILVADELDAVLITHPANRRYLSGYTADDHAPDESSGVLLISAHEAVLFTSPNNSEWAAADSPHFRVLTWKRPWTDTVSAYIREAGWTQLGFENQSILYARVAALTAAFSSELTLVPLEAKITALRSIKSADEIATLKRAIQLTDEIFAQISASLTVGMTEKQIAWSIEREMRERGAQGPGFETIVASGPHAARPHHRPTDRAIQEGEPIIVDMGAKVDGYNADLTRTIWLGTAQDRLKDVYNVVYEAQSVGLTSIHAGMTGADADRIVRDVITSNGYGDEFVHGLGHGVGLQVHELPSASPTSKGILQTGEILTIEPGIYLPGWGGVRIEDIILIQDKSNRVLTTAPKRGPQEPVNGRNIQ